MPILEYQSRIPTKPAEKGDPVIVYRAVLILAWALVIANVLALLGFIVSCVRMQRSPHNGSVYDEMNYLIAYRQHAFLYCLGIPNLLVGLASLCAFRLVLRNSAASNVAPFVLAAIVFRAHSYFLCFYSSRLSPTFSNCKNPEKTCINRLFRACILTQ